MKHGWKIRFVWYLIGTRILESYTVASLEYVASSTKQFLCVFEFYIQTHSTNDATSVLRCPCDWNAFEINRP